jgi:hypothetical protein
MKAMNRMYTLLYGDKIVPAIRYVVDVFNYYGEFIARFPQHNHEFMYTSDIFYNYVKNEVSKNG